MFATIFTCIIGGLLGEYLGRKTVCSIGSPIFLASFLCVTFAPSMHLLFFGQVVFNCICDSFFLNSIQFAGARWSCPGYCVFSVWGIKEEIFNFTTKVFSKQIYISEVTTPAWRMTLNSGISSFVTLGMVIVFTLGKVRQCLWKVDKKWNVCSG